MKIHSSKFGHGTNSRKLPTLETRKSKNIKISSFPNIILITVNLIHFIISINKTRAASDSPPFKLSLQQKAINSTKRHSTLQ
jgi:hypothetical protein